MKQCTSSRLEVDLSFISSFPFYLLILLDSSCMLGVQSELGHQGQASRSGLDQRYSAKTKEEMRGSVA